ncbi:MAG: cyclase family protein [Chloroflexi bacterium]|nr:cyclase family protein [Chloroflexota bacterium]
MKIIDITMPLYNGVPTGREHTFFQNHPLWPEAFKMEETRSYEQHGVQSFVYTMFMEPATRFIVPSYRKEYRDGPRLHNMDLSRVVLRDMVVVDTPKGDDEILEADELEAAFRKAPVQRADALLIRSGWGDNERYFKMGYDYKLRGPHFNDASVNRLLDLMAENGSDLWLYDMSDMRGVDKRTGVAGGFAIRAGIMAVGGVVNCGAITQTRAKLIVLPLKIQGASMAPCRAVVIEE